MDKFRNKYRITSTRLQNWDYGSNGAYYITMVTAQREHFFGEIVQGEMQLSEIGKIAEKNWVAIPDHFSFIELGNWVVMPNHIHGILIINKLESPTVKVAETSVAPVETPKLGVSTEISTTANASKKWKPNTIGSIINQFKRICTIQARKIDFVFAWQERFYDHIVRDSADFERIQNYISDNPSNWKEDKFQ